MTKYHKILDEGLKIRNQGLALFTDRERAAKAYYQCSMFKTVVDKYGDTEIAEFVKGQCDNYIDYKPTDYKTIDKNKTYTLGIGLDKYV